jgi:outer membrane protein assembly factor BamD (BamD/ComL family)
MSEQPSSSSPDRVNQGRLVSAALSVAAIILALASLIWSVGQFWAIWSPIPDEVVPPDRGLRTLTVLLLLVVGWSGSLLLWALGTIAVRLEEALRILEELPTSSEPAGKTPPQLVATEAGGGESLSNMLTVLKDIRDVALLDDEQRHERLEAQIEEYKQQLHREIPKLIREHRWITARQKLRDARERFPGVPEWETLRQQVEQARSAVEEHDVEAARQKIDELTAMGAWDRAVELVRELVQHHPESQAADELAHRVVQERQQAQQQELSELMTAAQEATNQREWAKARELADQIITRFPKSVEAEALRQQRPTLVENAEIQLRHQMEAQIRAFIRDRHYSDALALARSLVEKYPNSPQAAVLKDQMPRLEQRAAEQAGYTS